MSLKDVDVNDDVYQIKRSGSITGNRSHYRHPVHWRIALVYKNGDKNDIYHGRTLDLSVRGAQILVEHNIFMMSDVVLLLAIPPLHTGQKETIIEIDCRMAHTILSSKPSLFRIGLHFLYFKGEGKRILSDVLSKRLIPKSEQR